MDPAGDELIFVRRIYTFCETLEFLENLKIMLFKWIKLLKINKTRAYQLISKIKIRSVQIKRMTTYSCVILCYFIMHSTEYRVSCVGCSWWIKIFPSFVSLDQRQSPQACSDPPSQSPQRFTSNIPHWAHILMLIIYLSSPQQDQSDLSYSLRIFRWADFFCHLHVVQSYESFESSII